MALLRPGDSYFPIVPGGAGGVTPNQFAGSNTPATPNVLLGGGGGGGGGG